MSRSRVAFLLVSLLIVAPLIAATFAAAAERGSASGGDSFYKYLGVFTEVLSLVRQTYVDDTKVDSLMANALDGTTDALDAFSQYVPASAVSSYLETQKIGPRRSGLHLARQGGVAYVVALDSGAPAAKAGIEVGDIVAELQGKDTRLTPLYELEGVLAGAVGTEIHLRLLRLGEAKEARFVLTNFAPAAPSIERIDGEVVLHVPSFGERTAWAVRGLLGKNRSAGRLLLDLRGVAGGDPDAAYAVARLFVQGELGTLAGRKGQISTFTASEKPAWNGRIVVLVDRGTLGAAEVLATVLKQKVGAELVGERTFGYAGRLAAVDLSSGGRLIYTDAFYSGPDRKPLRESLLPDVPVDERVRTFEDKDTPLDDLILKHGLRRLAAPAEPAKKAA